MSGKSLRRTKRALSWVLGPLLIGYMGWYLIDHRSTFTRSLEVDLWTLAGMSLLVVITLLVRPLQMHIMLRAVGMKMPLKRSLMLIFASNVLNYLPMRPGTLMQATVLKRQARLKYASFISVFAAQMLVLTTGAALIAAVATTWRLAGDKQTDQHIYMLLAVTLAATVLPIAVLHLPASLARRKRIWIERAVYDLLLGWQDLRSRHLDFAAIMALTVVKLLSTAGRLWLAFTAFNVPVDIVACVTLAAVIQMTFLVSFTPGGLGLRQFLVAITASGLGMQFSDGMFASTLDHGIAILVTMLMGLPCVLMLIYGKNPELKDINTTQEN